MTEFYMITDTSENYQDTWRFMSERVDEALAAKEQVQTILYCNYTN